jgi:UDP-galactopyranose mutase
MKFDWVVIGAGFTGATFAERMATAGNRVLVIDRRSHLGGNAYDEKNEHGILVHRYGPHIFHTNGDVVWNYLSNFTEWQTYEHHVLGLIEGELVPIPFNLNSLSILFSPNEALRIEKLLVAEYGFGKKVPILKLKNSNHTAIRNFAEYVFKNVFEGYTLKQWQLRPEELSPSVTARVPVSVSRDDRYFQDKYQAMPVDGYSAMFRRMLRNKNITISLESNWTEVGVGQKDARVLFTGAIDELLSYRYGPLPYRSLDFKEQTLLKERHQLAAVINYPNDHDYTRITEQKVITGQRAPVTTLITEFPRQHEPGKNIAYYPIPRDDNLALYTKYADAAKIEFPNFHFAGRLADYQYYNMDQACARALKLASDCGGPAW